MAILGTERDRFWLKELLLRHAVQKRAHPFTLSSGGTSEWYIDCRKVTTRPDGLWLIAKIFYEYIKDTEVTAIGGMANGAIPIATAVSLVSAYENKQVKAFWLEPDVVDGLSTENYNVQGNVNMNDLVLIVDDVVTSGKSIANTMEILELAAIDRIFGAAVIVRRDILANYSQSVLTEIRSVFTMTDLTSIYPPPR